MFWLNPWSMREVSAYILLSWKKISNFYGCILLSLGHSQAVSMTILQQYLANIKFLKSHPADISLT